MKKHLFTLLCLCFLTASLNAGEERHGPPSTEVTVNVGTPDGKMIFVPDKLTFERGTYYKLVIHNPSNDEHYFSSDAFANRIFTRKVEVVGADGKTVTEIHGAVHDLELKPGATVEWYFFPMTKGDNLKLYCHKKGHEDAGMTGRIDIIGSL